MASSVYRSARPTPRGTTTSTAPHARHLYRRASTVVEPGAVCGSSGPSTSRLRSPWPTTVNRRPGSRLAAPQHGQLAGRTAEHDGGDVSQNLTSIADWMIRTSLRGIACNCLQAERGGRTVLDTPPATFLSEPRARAFSPPRPSTTTAPNRARNAQAQRGRWTRSPPDLPQTACARSGVDPSTTLRGNTQHEIRAYATTIGRAVVAAWCPLTWEAFEDYRLNQISLHATDLTIIQHLAAGRTDEATQAAIDCGLLVITDTATKRSRECVELEAKIRRLGLSVPWST